MLGEFEYLLLSASLRLGEGAYGAAIRQDIERSTGHPCSIGALSTTLDRLEAKGLVETWMGDATPQRGGRSKRMVRVTRKGIEEAASFYQTVTRASVGLSWAHDRLLVAAEISNQGKAKT
jgi:PadR family transcriptional regulator PadR